ncbi:hypothetical protein Tco_1394469 [Tanacetum coccineum]
MLITVTSSRSSSRHHPLHPPRPHHHLHLVTTLLTRVRWILQTHRGWGKEAQVYMPLGYPFKDLKWSNVPRIKLSSLSESDDTFLSLQALSNFHYLFGGFMDYLWSRELDISNFGPADRKILPVVSVSPPFPKIYNHVVLEAMSSSCLDGFLHFCPSVWDDIRTHVLIEYAKALCIDSPESGCER